MNQPDGGPAFPVFKSQFDSYSQQHLVCVNQGMSLRNYACIHLGIPETGTDWLDALIVKGQRARFAAAALQGMMESWKMVSAEQVATWAYQQADALLKAREQPVG